MIHGKSVMAVIAAPWQPRSGTPDSNCLRTFHSLLSYSIEQVRNTHFVDRMLVAVSDESLLTETSLFLSYPHFLLPEGMSDISLITQEALQKVPDQDIVISLQIDAPVRSAQDIDTAIVMMEDQHAYACASVSVPPFSPYWMLTVDNGQPLLPLIAPDGYYSGLREIPETYYLNDVLYCAETWWFRENLSFITSDTIAYVVSHDHHGDTTYIPHSHQPLAQLPNPSRIR